MLLGLATCGHYCHCSVENANRLEDFIIINIGTPQAGL